MDNEQLQEKYQAIMQAIEDKEFTQAVEILEEILAEEPKFAPAYNKLGVVKARAGEIDEAKEYFEKAIEYWPEFSAPYSNLGNIYLEYGEDETAEYYYNQAVKINDKNRIPYNNLAKIYKQRKQLTTFVKYQKLSHKCKGVDGDQEVFERYFNRDVPDKLKQGGMLGCLPFTGIMVAGIVVIGMAAL